MYIFLWREMEVAVSIHTLVRRSHHRRPKVVTYI
jgi:hypothetical protein